MTRQQSPDELSQMADKHLVEAAKLGDADGTCYAMMAVALEVRALRIAITDGDGRGQSRGLGDLFELLRQGRS